MKKALFIFGAITLGSIFSQGHAFTFLIRYNLMAMLFFAFLGIRFDWKIFRPGHFKILLVNILLPILLYVSLKNHSPTFAQIAFLLTIIPTAAAVPVIAELLKSDIVLTTGALLLTTPIIALVLPILLPNLLGIGADISTIELILPIISVVFIPLLLSQVLQIGFPKWSNKLNEYSFLSFPLFLVNIVIACGKASHFIQQNFDLVKAELVGIMLMTILLCMLNFRIGRFIGRKENALAFELSLGRKNTMIGLWLALTYFSPIIALGPIFYIICHNVYNSFQIWQMEQGT